MSSINSQYKDRLFNFIFGREENKEWTLSLNNAVNGSDYTDSSVIEFNTIKDVLYMGMRNDTSFMIADIMSVYEHQSTFNPNMPLRLLQYVGDLYAGYLSENKLNKYGKTLIKLPIPKLVVFYNGFDEIEEESVLKLSDAFEDSIKKQADVEVKVRMINVNYGKNQSLMNACKPLSEYSWFISEIRNNQRNDHKLEEAVTITLNKMPHDFAIRGFLLLHKQEVQGMLDTEYNETEVMELFKEEGKIEGKTEGIQIGADMVNRLNTILIEAGRLDDLARESKDREYQKKLIRELIDKDFE